VGLSVVLTGLSNEIFRAQSFEMSRLPTAGHASQTLDLHVVTRDGVTN
jgi:hypothetical protein